MALLGLEPPGSIPSPKRFCVEPRPVLSYPGLASSTEPGRTDRKVGKLGEWFDTSAFAAPAYGFYGTQAMERFVGRATRPLIRLSTRHFPS